jgi:lipopolysaccharide transport system ATP-binding protein
MSDLALHVHDLSKCYRLHHRPDGYRTLRETLSDLVRRPHHPSCQAAHPKERSFREASEILWALRNVSFEVKRGEVVGIIGRNGAGKSTLLRILSRITEPTEGWAEIHGRVGSLLEVGTGFHGELTGRENIYLSGALLGMKKAEIDRKFDEIVAFAEIEKFLDTPVKRYSSGMYLRLAFAVAAHLEPEILLVDEVLAVGDNSFQKKCLNKMQDVGKEGRTVLFVSHNLPAITRLCPRTLLLQGGRLTMDGPSPKVVHYYLRCDSGTHGAREWRDILTAPGNDIVRFRAVRARTAEGQVSEAFDIRRPIQIEMEYEVLRSGHILVPNLHFFNEEGICLFASIDLDPSWRKRPRAKGTYCSTAWIPGDFLSEGNLTVRAAISTLDPLMVHVDVREAISFQVVDRLEGDSARGDYAGPMPGLVRPLLQWTTQFRPEIDRVPPAPPCPVAV